MSEIKTPLSREGKIQTPLTEAQALGLYWERVGCATEGAALLMALDAASRSQAQAPLLAILHTILDRRSASRAGHPTCPRCHQGRRGGEVSALWWGETWLCEVETCETANAILRKRCRSCGADYPGVVHPDPEINRAIQAEMQQNVAHDRALGLRK